MIETGRAGRVFGLTEENAPEIYAAWRSMKKAMGATPMAQTEGDLGDTGEPSFQLKGTLAADPTAQQALASDAVADELLRNRSTLDYLKRRGGLTLTEGMTQEAKRAAVRQALTQAIRQGRGEKLPLDTKGSSLVEVFKRAGEYLSPGGAFDVDTAKQDYKSFLQNIPEKGRMYLEQSLDAAEWEESDNPKVVFGYDVDTDKIVYNPTNPDFGEYDLAVVFTHELAHRIDKFFVRSHINERFVQAILDAEKILDADPEAFIQFCKENDRDGFISDILSAICKGKYEFPTGHGVDYWAKEYRQPRETFANLFSLEAYRDTEKMEFLRKHFPELIACFEAMDFQI